MKDRLLSIGDDTLTFEDFRDLLTLSEVEADEVANFLFEKGFIIDKMEHGKRIIEASADFEILENDEDELQKLENEIGLILKKRFTDDRSGYDAIETYPENEFFITKLVKSVQIQKRRKVDGETHTWYETQYKIWQCEWGQKGKEFYLFTHPDREIQMGQVKMATNTLKSTDLDDFKKPSLAPVQIEAIFGLKNMDGIAEEGWEAIKTAMGKDMVEIRTPIEPLKEDQKQKVVDNIDIQKAIDIKISQDHSLDDDIHYVFRSSLVDFNDGTIDPKNVMPYNPHVVLVTNTGVGKSTSASNCGTLVEDASGSGLLGFSSSDETTTGALHNKNGMIAFDEIEKSDNKFLSKLPSFLANGTARIFKGKAPVVTKGSCQVMAFANPYTQQEYNDEQDGMVIHNDDVEMQRLMESFDQVLNLISTGSSHQALGRRFGVILFGNDFQEAKKDPDKDYSDSLLRKNDKIVESMLRQCQHKITRLFYNTPVQNWIAADLNEYDQQVKHNLMKKSTLLPAVKDFWQGNTAGNERMRGFAIKQAILDNIEEIWLDEDFDEFQYIDQVIEDAEKHLSKLMQINLESLQRMGAVEDTEQDIVYHRFRSLDGYKSNLMLAFAHVIKDDASYISDDRPVTIDQLADAYAEIDESVKEGRMDKFWKVKKNIPESVGKLSSEFKSKFDVNIKDIGNGDYEFYAQSDKPLVVAKKKFNSDVEVSGSDKVERNRNPATSMYKEVYDYIDERGTVEQTEIEEEFDNASKAVKKLSNDGEIWEEDPGVWKSI